MPKRPKILNTPGLTWRSRSGVWEARWRPRFDLVKRGYPATPVPLWKGTEPTATDVQWMSDRCNVLQAEMLTWGRGGVAMPTEFDGTIAGLLAVYQKDELSKFHKLRYGPRLVAASQCRIIEETCGKERLEDIRARHILEWHHIWSKRGVSMAHGLVGRLRTVIGHGADFLKTDPDCQQCERVGLILHRQKFEMGKSRTERLTADQAIQIREMAHRCLYHSVAVAQAFQFECMFRQKDVIGEWLPLSEPGLSDVTYGTWKWLRGLRWEEIDQNFMLKHTTSKREKEIQINLRAAPMVMQELNQMAGLVSGVSRDLLPANGPVIISENTALPWEPAQFRVRWRKFANLCKIPKTVKNMDTRAGAISEATDAGAPLESVKHAATHSDISMTQRYSRSAEEKIAEVQKIRVAHRNKK